MSGERKRAIVKVLTWQCKKIIIEMLSTRNEEKKESKKRERNGECMRVREISEGSDNNL